MGFTLDDVIKTHDNGVVLWDRRYFTTQTRVAFAFRERYSPHKQLQNVLLLEFYFCFCFGFETHVCYLFYTESRAACSCYLLFVRTQGIIYLQEANEMWMESLAAMWGGLCYLFIVLPFFSYMK